jgi:hypothetical protein
MFVWGQVVFFSLGAILLVPGSDALQIAWLRVITVFAGFLIWIWLLMSALKNIRLIDIGRTVARPLVGAGLMALAILIFGRYLSLGPYSALTLKVGLGLLIYPVSILLMWRLAGRPSGAESYLLDKVLAAWQARKQPAKGSSEK